MSRVTSNGNGIAESPPRSGAIHYPRPVGADTDNLDSHGTSFKLTNMASVTPERIAWIWEGYLARGKLTLLTGDPDLGKSQIALDIAARITRGTHFPQGAEAPVGEVLLITSEDDPHDTIAPRLEANGADVQRIEHLGNYLSQKGKRGRRLNLRDNLEIMAAALARMDKPRLIIVDALSSYLGEGTQGNSQNDIRAIIDPVSEWAGENRIAVLGIMHPPKGKQDKAIHLVGGSFAFAAAARIVLGVMRDPDNPERRLMVPIKCNIGQKPLGRGYSIQVKQVSTGSSPYIVWDDAPVDYTADQLTADNPTQNGGAESEAKDFLRQLLANGPVEAGEVKRAANADFIRERTLNRAKKTLKVESKKEAGKLDGGWYWRLP